MDSSCVARRVMPGAMLLTHMKQTTVASLVVFMLSTLAVIAGCARSTDDGGAENPAVARKIETYLTDFGMPGTETSWYKNITGVSVRGNTVHVRTNLFSSSRKVSDICAAVSGYVFSNHNRSDGLDNVQVLGQNGQVLVNRRGVGGRCD